MSLVPMTVYGAEKLREELNKLKHEARPKVVKDIAVAREHGDLKEDAEYHAAREQQGFIEGRIQELEGKLSNAQIIDPKSLNVGDKVVFGATVELVESESGKEVTYQIIGDDEADIKVSKISVNSPVARALIGKEIDDVALVQTPGGEHEYEIVAVRYD